MLTNAEQSASSAEVEALCGLRGSGCLHNATVENCINVPEGWKSPPDRGENCGKRRMASFAAQKMSSARAERPGWGRWEQLAWSDLAPAEQGVEASGEPEGGVVASSVHLWSPSRIRSPPGFDEAAIDGLRQSLLTSPPRSGVILSVSRRDERRDERRRSAGDDVVSALVSMPHRA